MKGCSRACKEFSWKKPHKECKYERMWVNIQHVKKIDEKQKKKGKLQSGKQSSGMLWREKHVLNNNKDVLKV